MMSLSCVTMKTAQVLLTFFKILKTVKVVFSSKEPVGSSAKMIFGDFTNALAMDTLCCSPPDKLETNLFVYLAIPSCLKT